jgi:hypothetical protein
MTIHRASGHTAKPARSLGSALAGRCSSPTLVAIQEISARIVRVTGRGLAGNICRHYPNWLLKAIVALLFFANAINLGADLAAMGDALKLLVGGPGTVYVVIFGIACFVAQLFVQYADYCRSPDALALAASRSFPSTCRIGPSSSSTRNSSSRSPRQERRKFAATEARDGYVTAPRW